MISQSSPVIGSESGDSSPNSSDVPNEPNLHEFLLIHLTKSFDDQEVRKLYADYKSRGGVWTASKGANRRLILKEPLLYVHPDSAGVKHSQSKYDQRLRNHYDCLDIFNRQQLAVLFYSQCETSPVYPNICIKPRVINMKFYGENDMTLGSNY